MFYIMTCMGYDMTFYDLLMVDMVTGMVWSEEFIKERNGMEGIGNGFFGNVVM